MKTKITVLGAGYMGSAQTFPLVDNRTDVSLWGTWLDDDIIHQCKSGSHPKLGQRIDETIDLYDHTQLELAVSNAKYLVMATSSNGYIPVFSRLISFMVPGQTVIALTKGFADSDDRVETLSEATKRIARENGVHWDLSYGAIGGPVKAVELAGHIPSAAVLAGRGETLDEFISFAQTPYYSISRTDDLIGVEISTAFKNVYAIAIGICDGIFEKNHAIEYHNLPAALFSQSIFEISRIVVAAGGNKETVFGLSGVGDLHVTARSGKNQEFGRLIGTGVGPLEAYDQMLNEGRQAEGYLAFKSGLKWIRSKIPNVEKELPLLTGLKEILSQNGDPKEILQSTMWKNDID